MEYLFTFICSFILFIYQTFKRKKDKEKLFESSLKNSKINNENEIYLIYKNKFPKKKLTFSYILLVILLVLS